MLNVENRIQTKRIYKHRISLAALLICCVLVVSGCSCANRSVSNADITSSSTTQPTEEAKSDPTASPQFTDPTGSSDASAISPASDPADLSNTPAPTGATGQETTPAPADNITDALTNSPEPTDPPAVTDVPTDTPIPTEAPTDTPVPSASPEPTNVPDDKVITATPAPTEPPKDTKVTATPAPTAPPKDADDDSKKTGSAKLAAPSNSGALSLVGTQLSDKNGNPIQLRGVSTHGIAWFPNYVNAKLFKELKAEWNVNIVRLAMYTAEYAGYCTGGDQAKLKKLVKDGVMYATDADLYVIIDWHVLNDQDPNTYISEAKDFFKEMSKEYASYDNVIYEICNEPNGGTSWASIKKYALEIIPIIKANNPDAVIIVGTPNWSQYVDQAAKDPITGYTNIMYALHFYAATHKDDLRKKMTGAISSGLPIFVTEYGICDASGNGGIDYDSAKAWTSLMDKNGISYVCWNLSNKNETSALFKSSCSKTSGFSMDDMSDEGKWLRELLGAGNTPDNSGRDTSSDNNSGNTHNGNDKTPPAASPLPAEGVSGDLSYTLTVSNSWESEGSTYYQYDLAVKNTGTSATESWSITIPLTTKVSVSNIWCAAASVSDAALTISNESFNGQIAPGAEVSGVGIILCPVG